MKHWENRKIKIILLILSFSLASTVIASTQVGRYLTVDNNVSSSQADPLQQKFQISFPASIQTVGDAIRFILINTGYQLVAVDRQKNMVEQLLVQPLPLSVRTLGPTTVQLGLQALAGNVYQLVIDPAHRLVTFRLKTKYQTIYETSSGDLL